MKILITGAASGLGLAITNLLATNSNELVLVDRERDSLEQIKDSLSLNSINAHLLVGDLGESEFISEIKNYIQKNKIDVLINNAAISHKLMPLVELSSEDLDIAYKVNLKAPFELMISAIENMNENGQIINITSRANIYGYPTMGVYAATKAALTSLTQTAGLENPQIKSIPIILGRTNTPMQTKLRGEQESKKAQNPSYVAEIISKILNDSIQVANGEFVLIDFGKYKVCNELIKTDLHSHMNTAE